MPSSLRTRATVGSSPRVRGEVRELVIEAADGGIIPAGAGRRGRGAHGFGGDGDHPRGCGEKALLAMMSVRKRGSSPRVRGEGIGSRGRSSRWGIIPAGAGRRAGDGDVGVVVGDHPRGCGEKVERPPHAAGEAGSSPRVRGEVLALFEGLHLRGIIPAGAGRSNRFCRRLRHEGDHPRGCGEKRL